MTGMTYLSPPEINALIDALVSGLPSLYATVQPTDRQEAFAAEANGILELVPPEHQLAAFERLEAVVLQTNNLTANLSSIANSLTEQTAETGSARKGL